ncbi:MAG: hypothetical protein ABSA45_00310 [Verrucomicrobiota bacterium]
MGSAPARGAVFRARPRRAKARQRDGGAENIGRSEISRTPVSVTRARGWTRGASSHTRSVCASLRRDRAEAGGEGGGGCAPQRRNSGLMIFLFQPGADLMQKRADPR